MSEIIDLFTSGSPREIIKDIGGAMITFALAWAFAILMLFVLP